MPHPIMRRLLPAHHYDYLSWCKDRFGLLGVLASYAAGWRRAQPLVRVATPLAPRGVYLRPGTVDQVLFDEVFLQKVYQPDALDPTFIVDAGAHIGLAAIFFAVTYPRATVVAIEPEESNFEMLVRNTEAYPSIHPIKAGLWSHKTFLRIRNATAASWSYQVSPTLSGQGISAVTIDDMLSRFGVSHIDVLKVDIEGAELEVFKHANSWIDKVGTLIVELHDRHRPGCSEALEEAVKGRGFARMISGEKVVLKRRARSAA